MTAHHWKRNLIFVWLSQFFSLMGFAFAMPFVPFYMQELGVTDPFELKIWVALFAGASPLTIALFSPMWGALADRYGRKIMLVRANLGAALVLSLMGAVHSVGQLVVLRLLQGVLTGTVTAAQAMVAVGSPEERSGAALGSLSAAVYSGSMTGALAGGVLAHWFGYRIAFFCSGGLMIAATLLVLFGTYEPGAPGADAEEIEGVPSRFALLSLRDALPILAALGLVSFTRQFDVPYLPLLVQRIHGGIEGVSLWTGVLSAVGGAAGLGAGFLLGPLADRYSPVKVGRTASALAGLAMIAQAVAMSFAWLIPIRFAMVFFAGALEPAIHAWLARSTPPGRRGAIFGLASSARSLGWLLSAVGGGGVAALAGIESVFFVNAGLYFLLIVVLARLLRPPQAAAQP